MRHLFYLSLICLIAATGFNCGDSGVSSSPECDSIKIAQIIAKRYPDTIPGLTKSQALIPVKYRPSEVISEREARQLHINYLLSGGIIDNKNQVLHSLWLDREDLDRLQSNSETGARLYFCVDEEDDQRYLSIIMVPVDGDYKNKLVEGTTSLIINKLQPCPDKCPNGINNRYDDINDENDLNFDRYNDFQNNGWWYKPNIDIDKWVDRNNRVRP